MAEKMLESTRAGMTRSSSRPASIYGNRSLELEWENGQVLVKGGSSSITKKIPSCIGYSTNPSRSEEADGEDACIAKSARPSALHSLLDFPVQRDSSHRNFHQISDQNSCQLDSPYSKSKSCGKLEESKLTGRAHQPPTTGNGYSCTSSKQQFLPSAPFKKPRMEPIQTPATKSPMQDLGKVNFSNILRPPVFAKSTYQGKSATLPTNNNTALARVDEIKATKVAKAAAAATSSKNPDHSVVIDSSRGSRGNTGLQGQNPLISDASKPVSFVARTQEPLPYKESEAVGHNSALSIPGSAGLRAKRKADTSFCNDPLLEYSSVCSLGASNNTDICSRKQGVADDSTYLSDNDEETEDVVKEKHAREGTRVERSRNAETHNLYERKRRDKINEKMRVLKELIPNCNKVDKASMLDDAIEYLKTLQLQLQPSAIMQILSMGRGLCMPLMMLPTAPHHMINTPHLPHLMGAGMSFRPGTGIPCNLPRFPIPPLPGVSDNRVRMFGFPSQMLPMPMSHAPFIPMVGKPSTQPLQATCTATNLAENLAAAHSNSKGLLAPNNSL